MVLHIVQSIFHSYGNINCRAGQSGLDRTKPTVAVDMKRDGVGESRVGINL